MYQLKDIENLFLGQLKHKYPGRKIEIKLEMSELFIPINYVYVDDNKVNFTLSYSEMKAEIADRGELRDNLLSLVCKEIDKLEVLL